MLSSLLLSLSLQIIFFKKYSKASNTQVSVISQFHSILMSINITFWVQNHRSKILGWKINGESVSQFVMSATAANKIIRTPENFGLCLPPKHNLMASYSWNIHEPCYFFVLSTSNFNCGSAVTRLICLLLWSNMTVCCWQGLDCFFGRKMT